MARASAPARFEIFDEQAVAALLDPAELIDRLEGAFLALSRGECVAPSRLAVEAGGGYSLSMPAYRAGGPIMVKIVNVFEGNAGRGLPTHHALVCLFDADTGACTSVLDGTTITNRRTAAASALSTRLLARDDARVLTIVGAGAQAREHLALVPLVRELEEIRVVSRRLEDASRLADRDPRAFAVDSAEEAVRGSDVVCLCTNAGSAAVAGEWIAPGTHVTSVGFRAPDGELPASLLDRASLFVETRLAFAPPPSGCYELHGLDPDAATELGDVLAGTRPGRRAGDEITVYKSMGHAVEDLVAAELVLACARTPPRGSGRLGSRAGHAR